MQIPLLSGIVASERADFGYAYPVNLEPVPIETGISQGYLRSATGAVKIAEGPGGDRGGILWNNRHIRVMGTSLVSVSATGVIAVLGDVGAGEQVRFDYGFDRLAICSGERLYYWDGISLVQVTDPDLGPCQDIQWLKGQYFSTDGNYIVATQLSDPTQVDPLKYGSAEADPDMVTGLLRIRNEMAVLGTNTIEFFTYTGGSGFPLSANDGATIPFGCVGRYAKCLFAETFAFVGGSRNEANGVRIAGSGTAQKISTRAIDDLIAAQSDPSAIRLEAWSSRNEQRLLVRLQDRTLVYLLIASQAAGKPIWYEARSGRGMDKPFRPVNAVLVNGAWICGDAESNSLGRLDDAEARHFGEEVGWMVTTQLIYNGGKGGILHDMELIGLPGRGGSATVYWSRSLDGETWSMERGATMAPRGNRGARCQWRPHARFSNYMALRFRGDSSALAGFAALEATIEGLRT